MKSIKRPSRKSKDPIEKEAALALVSIQNNFPEELKNFPENWFAFRWDENKVIELLRTTKYKNATDFIRQEGSAYHWLSDNNKLHILYQYIPRAYNTSPLNPMNVVVVTEILEKQDCKSRPEFYEKYSTAYKWLCKNDIELLDKYYPLVNSRKLDRNVIIKILEKQDCKSRPEFYEKYSTAYKWLCKNDIELLDKYYPSNRLSRLQPINENICIDILKSKRYTCRSKFKHGQPRIYKWLEDNDKLYILDNYFDKATIRWDENKIIKLLKECVNIGMTRTEFREKHNNAAQWIGINNKYSLLNKYYPEPQTYHNLNEDNIKELLKKKYSGRDEFAQKNRKAINWMKHHKKLHLLDEVYPPRQIWDELSVIQTLEKKHCKNRTEFSAKYSGVVRWMKNNNKLYLYDEHYPLDNITWDKNKATKVLNSCENIKELQRKYSGAYGWLKLNCPILIHEKSSRQRKSIGQYKWTYETALADIKDNGKKVGQNKRSAYKWVIKNKLTERLNKDLACKI